VVPIKKRNLIGVVVMVINFYYYCALEHILVHPIYSLKTTYNQLRHLNKSKHIYKQCQSFLENKYQLTEY